MLFLMVVLMLYFLRFSPVLLAKTRHRHLDKASAAQHR